MCTFFSEDLFFKSCIEEFKRLEHLLCVRRKQLESLALCSAKAFAGAFNLTIQMFWTVSSFFLPCEERFLTIHFNLITIRGELLLCGRTRRRRKIYYSVCLFVLLQTLSSSTRLSEPLDIYVR